ncbi:MAG: hypothetical protein BWY02_02257 [bacterium ADurb.Bin157]|nr:MAG: hypothetical protein BWY02_02257 [bacterium ADurb.Bin157]
MKRIKCIAFCFLLITFSAYSNECCAEELASISSQNFSNEEITLDSEYCPYDGLFDDDLLGDDSLPEPVLVPHAFSSLSEREIGAKILELRQAGNYSEIGELFVDFFYHKRTKRDILNLIKIIGLPLKTKEIEAIEDVLLSKSSQMRYYPGVNFGYTIEVHATPSTRISLIYLSSEEMEIYKNWMNDKYHARSKREEFVSANLEGRLCVWPKRRKIHLGGPRLPYERAKEILLEKKLD